MGVFGGFFVVLAFICLLLHDWIKERKTIEQCTQTYNRVEFIKKLPLRKRNEMMQPYQAILDKPVKFDLALESKIYTQKYREIENSDQQYDVVMPHNINYYSNNIKCQETYRATPTEYARIYASAQMLKMGYASVAMLHCDPNTSYPGGYELDVERGYLRRRCTPIPDLDNSCQELWIGLQKDIDQCIKRQTKREGSKNEQDEKISII